MPLQQPGGSGFPSMAAFMGENPSKRPRMQEPQKETPFSNVEPADPEANEEEVWEELDEDAMEECMILATQMCTGQLDESKRKTPTPYGQNNGVNISRSGTLDQFGDSGFSSARGTSLDSSRVFHTSLKNRVTNNHPNAIGKGNAYANKFSDFNTSVNSQRSPSVSVSRSHQNSGRVYNSIPLKGTNSNDCGSALGHTLANAGTSKTGSTVKNENLSKSTDSDQAKLQEEVLMMQGEIAMLRAELKRKETALDAERLERCTLIDSAEKKGKERALAASKESEKKVAECKKTIEKLQDDLHFKKREIEELQSQFQHLEKKMQQQSLSPSQKNIKAKDASPKRPSSNFKDRFDFGKNSVCTSNMEVQTELPYKEIKAKRPRLNVNFSRGRGHIGRQLASSLSSEGSVVCKNKEFLVKTGKWSIDSEWRNVMGKAVLDDGDCDRAEDLQRQLLTFSIQRLEEACAIFAPERTEALSKDSKSCDTYESQVVPALSIMKCLSTTKCSDLSEKAIRTLCSHLPQQSLGDKTVNNHLWPLVLQALGQISKITEQISKAESLLIIEKLNTFCEGNCTDHNLLVLLQLLQDLIHHKHVTNNLCTSKENCFIDKLCIAVSKQQGDHLAVAKCLQNWLSVVVSSSPAWLCSKCSCPAKLLAALLKKIQISLSSILAVKDLQMEDLRKLLVPTVQLLHVWSLKDSAWWEKIAYLPHYTAIMSAIANNAKAFNADRQTVDLLCDLYAFNEKTFDM